MCLVIHWFAKGAVLAKPTIAADSDTHDETAPREVVERSGFASELPGSATRQRGNECTKVDALSLQSNGGEGNPWISDRRTHLRLDMIPKEEAIPTGILSFASKRSESVDIGKRTESGKVKCIAHKCLLETA